MVKSKKFRLILVLAIAAVLIGFGARWLAASSAPSVAPTNPVPADIRTAVSFPVYFPNKNALPAGYTFDESSFRQAEAGVIIFSLNQASNRQVIISEQEQPATSVIDDFIKQYVPLHTEFSTGLGKVKVGANGKAPDLRTVASLVINKGPWLIITAPPDIKQADLKQIIESFRS